MAQALSLRWIHCTKHQAPCTMHCGEAAKAARHAGAAHATAAIYVVLIMSRIFILGPMVFSLQAILLPSTTPAKS